MRSKRYKLTQNANSEDDHEHYLPPRTAIHPSEKGKWTKVFYQTLFWLFLMLIVGLTIWGIRTS